MLDSPVQDSGETFDVRAGQVPPEGILHDLVQNEMSGCQSGIPRDGLADPAVLEAVGSTVSAKINT